ncbi:condensation domain-containing protein, partial [uncultured Shewanella sp.]|uniref:condensation domain-containing protein n=1 Tax=uncultured Shewanella sp. TaxID=173975 RepID=UPI00262C1E6E
MKSPTLNGMSELVNNKPSKITRFLNALTFEEKAKGVEVNTHQQLLWPLYKSGQSSHYNIVTSYDIYGEVDFVKLKQALILLYRDFDTLHCIFEEQDERIVMKPSVSQSWSPSFLDGDESAVSKLCKVEQLREFNLTTGPLFKAHIVALSGGHTVLILNCPHIIFDGYSMTLFWRRLNLHYHQKPTSTIKFGYIDYLAQCSTTPVKLNYWKVRLKNYKPFKLHSLGPLSKNAIHTYHSQMSICDSNLLLQLAEKTNFSTFCVALYTWSKTLSEFISIEDIVVSTPYSNRQQPQLSEIAGYLVSMVPVRYRKGIHIGDFHHDLYRDLESANFDINALLSEIHLDSGLIQHPLQQVVFSWQEGIDFIPDINSLTISRRRTCLSKPKFPLSLTIQPKNDVFVLNWEFDPSILSESTIERLEFLFLSNIRGEKPSWPKMPCWEETPSVLAAFS